MESGAVPHLEGNAADQGKIIKRQVFPLVVFLEKNVDEEWIKTLADGRRVKFTNQELLETRAFITAQVESNKVVYSIVLTKVRNPLSREEVEGYFEGELSKK